MNKLKNKRIIKKGGLGFSGLKSFFQRENFTGRPLITLCLILLSLFCLVYFSTLGNGLMYFQESNLLFVFSGDYLSGFLTRPGGLLVYAGNFLTQFYYRSIYGILIIASLFFICSKLLFHLTGMLKAGKMAVLLALVPSLSIFILLTNYDFHLHDLLGIMLSVSLFIVISRFKGISLVVVSSVAFPPAWYLLGSYSVIYAGLILLWLPASAGRSGLTGMVVLAVTIPLTWLVFKDMLFFQPPLKLLLFPMLLNETMRITVSLSLLAGYIILLPILAKVSAAREPGENASGLVPLAGSIALFIGAGFIVINSYDPVRANVMKFEKMVSNHDWDGVIREHEKIQSANIVEQYYYNLSLAEKGELCSRMFFGRQSYGPLSLTLQRNDEQSHRAMHFYYTVGLTAEAHHLAYEQMVQHGYRPDNIRMLIRTELISWNFRVAERYLGVLRKTIFYRKWAEKYEKMLTRHELVDSDGELGAKKKLLPVSDFFVVADDFRNIDMLLASNPVNRIAFEYRLARFMLDKDFVEVGKEVRKLRGMGYDHLPRHIEEAVVSLVNATGEFPDMGGLAISSDTDQRFLQYFKDMKASQGKLKSTEAMLKKSERNTFWYYLQFGRMKSDFVKGEESNPLIY